jgi:hypothetical protein
MTSILLGIFEIYALYVLGGIYWATDDEVILAVAIMVAFVAPVVDGMSRLIAATDRDSSEPDSRP